MKNNYIEEESLENLVNNVDYSLLNDYIPTTFSLQFINFIKLVAGKNGLENKSPVFHLEMLDHLNEHENNLFVAYRGSSKTTITGEMLILYLAVYGKLKGVGDVKVGMYVSDTMENGIKNMRTNLEFRYNNSEFLKSYLPEVKFTENIWRFTNIKGNITEFRGFGISSGVRGFKAQGERPRVLILDDLMSDKNAQSPTIIKDIEEVVYKGARQALHPTKRKIIWTGTPFNKKDPLYKAACSKMWNTKVYPICNKFPCNKEEFVGAWEDRFPYEFVKKEYENLASMGKSESFYQELMLNVMSDEDRLVQDQDILFYSRTTLLEETDKYNFYITTDFATTEKTSSDCGSISVWAYSNDKEWLWVDGFLQRTSIVTLIDEIFRFVDIYKPLSVGFEKAGQQSGFIQFIQQEMIRRNKFFVIANKRGTNELGFQSSQSKLARFNMVLPLFKTRKIKFPHELKDSPILTEGIGQIKSVTYNGIKAAHDDFLDTVNMLALMNVWDVGEEEQSNTKNVDVNDVYGLKEINENEYDLENLDNGYFP